MVKYLYDASQDLTDDGWTHKTRGWLLSECIMCDLFDIALKILKDHPELATTRGKHNLEILARKPYAFNRVESNLFSRIINSFFGILMPMKLGTAEKESDAFKFLWTYIIRTTPKDRVDRITKGYVNFYDGAEHYHPGVLFVAAEMGNTRLDIYNLLHEIGSMKDKIIDLDDKDGNNMLHLVGLTLVKMLSQMCGASLLMQRELLWFKEVEKMIPHTYRKTRNKAGQTPYELFAENNKVLISQGLKWMKDCMVVATLIVTVAFAVAFTVPGGYNQDDGLPIYIHERTFLLFVLADAVSLFSSSTSLLVFLSILTSRHSQRDFMYSLPRKLMIGLLTLFISVAAMMVTFSASFFVLYHNWLKWVPILIAIFATMPVIIFAALQVPLLVDMFRSMYDSRYLFNPRSRILFNDNF